MKQRIYLWLYGAIALCSLATSPTQAQIVPDATLPNPSSVASEGNNSTISGGTTAGSNLFHSFEQFSVPKGGSAYFNNATDIQNILSRVTGSSASQIDGLIKANGTANLFLINPNGIIFGPNASLNVGGSFLASTASSLKFPDAQFSATIPQTTPLLTVNVPLGLQFGGNTKEIIVQSSSLQVQPSKTLAFVGGEVKLNGGKLTVLGGRVELGAVAGTETVGLNVNGNNLRLSFPQGVQRADVSLANKAQVKVSGGSVAINAQNLNLTQSNIQAGIDAGSGGVGFQAGDIEINATGAIDLTNNSAITNEISSQATGNAGSINIKTGSLSLTNRSQISGSTFGKGNAANVMIDARDNIILDAQGSDRDENLSGVFSRVGANNGRTRHEAEGNAGHIDIKTGSLLINNAAVLSTTTFGTGNAGNVTIDAGNIISLDKSSSVVTRVASAAQGNAGNIDITTGSLLLTNGGSLTATVNNRGDAGSVIVKARDTVSLDGVGGEGRNRQLSRITTSVWRGGEGKEGNIEIATRALSIANGAELSASALGNGNGGHITINANTVEVLSIGQILTNSRSNNGNAGDITLNATDSVTLAGSEPGYIFSPADLDRISIPVSASGLFASTSDASTGRGGDIRINTGRLIVRDGAVVNVSSVSAGAAGDIIVKANSIQLDSKGSIQATTVAGNQGNINVRSRDLLLNGGSNIITNATGTANGGNIGIDADILGVFGRSGISANALEGRGGNVQIDSQALFLSADSRITATSETGIDGVVEINRPDIDPTADLIVLPVQIVDVSGLVAQGCGNVASSKFVVTGRGGLPPTPSEATRSDAVLADLGTPDRENRVAISSNYLTSSKPSLVEANGWAIDDKGEVVLTAQATISPNAPWMLPAACRAPKSS